MKARPPLPKEHGAWGMLLTPLAVGLALSGLNLAAGLLTAAMVLAVYFARAPLEAVLKGRRDAHHVGWLAVEGLLAAGCAAALVRLTGSAAWLWVAVPAAPLGLVGMVLSVQGRGREVVAELSGALVLPLAAPLACAVGQRGLTGLGWSLWGAFALYNAATVPYIRTWVMARRAGRNETYQQTARATRRAAAVTLGVVLLVVCGLAAARLWPALLPLAYLPGALRVVFGLRRAGDETVPIQRLGWVEMAHAVGFAVLVGLLFAGRAGA